MEVWVVSVLAVLGATVAAGETSALEVLHATADVTVIVVFLWGAFRGAFYIATIVKQVTNNGGSSMKDKVEAAESAITELQKDMKELKEENAEQSRMLGELLNHSRLKRPNPNPHNHRET